MDLAQIRKILTETAEREEVHLLDVTRTGSGREKTLEIFVDSESGISADELGRMSALFSKEIEKIEADFGSHTFVVSSPGLERSLQYDWQYRRHKGRYVALKLHDIHDEASIHGRIVACDEGKLHIENNGKPHVIFLEKIQEAKIEVSFK